jgi:transcriptional regulator with PAS, ATPase and Fis domain
MRAREIHRLSPRAARPFLAFNCTAVPRDMLESQLFGYRRGAFTGAQEPFPGVIRAAAGGTLLLDEIGDLPLDVQPKLLRFLDTNEIHPLGEPQPIRVDVRVIAATNADLAAEVEAGHFRKDLYYRLNVFPVELPPLRERAGDIPALVEFFLRPACRRARRAVPSITPAALALLQAYPFPGNVRELENEIERAVALAEEGLPVGPELLSERIRGAAAAPRPATLAAAVEQLKRRMIEDALKDCGSKTAAAERLGLSRQSLQQMLRRRQ